MDVVKDWAILEADFAREYGIDLTKAALSWRRFLVLANGLSKDSVYTLTYQGRTSGEMAIDDDELAERAFARF